MIRHRAAFCLATLLVLSVASGTSCPRRWQPVPTAPAVFTAEPTLADVMRVVNGNRALVTSLISTRASLKAPGVPAMNASLAVGSPRHVRLRAGLGISGSELDLGSNERLFWMWVKRNSPPAVFFGYHDRFDGSMARQVLPVRPEWLVEALGLVYLDPGGRYSGPIRRADGKLEVRIAVATPNGDMTKALVVDGHSGWILEQHLFDPHGQLIASALNSQHLRDPTSGATLPRRTEIRWPPAGVQLILELGDVQFNPIQLSPDLWTKPEYPGFPNVDVTAPQGLTQMSPAQGIGPRSGLPGPSARMVPR